MLIISFAWTSGALLAGKKTATRREWDDQYAQLFVNTFYYNATIQAYDKNPRNGGKRIALIRLTKMPQKEPLSAMTMKDIEEEGGLWESVDQFIEGFGGDPDMKVWVVKFEVIKIEDDANQTIIGFSQNNEGDQQ